MTIALYTTERLGQRSLVFEEEPEFEAKFEHKLLKGRYFLHADHCSSQCSINVL